MVVNVESVSWLASRGLLAELDVSELLLKKECRNVKVNQEITRRQSRKRILHATESAALIRTMVLKWSYRIDGFCCDRCDAIVTDRCKTTNYRRPVFGKQLTEVDAR